MSRIIVKNLPSTITEKKLREIFEENGCITDLQLKYNKNGKFRKFAFIGYKTEDEAKTAKEYFNNTFVFTSKVQVEICSNLNDPNRPKAWKEFLKEKAEKQRVIETNQGSPTKENQKKKKKGSKSEENDVPAELKKDPKFKEFVSLHEDRKSKPLWADDIGAIEDSDKSEISSDDADGFDTFQKGEPEHEEKPVPCKEHKGKTIVHDFVYTVKLRNLPYVCKRKQIKEFFRPLKLASLRLPRGSKGFSYVSFKTEKDMNKALNKHGGYLDGHRIDVVKYTKKEICENNKKNEQVGGDKKVDLDLLAETGRIYVRNLCFSVTESELEELFSKYGPLAEVYLPRSLNKPVGFAFVTYLFAENAVNAFSELDGSIFQGRLLHLIPAEPKREEEIDENDTNYKKKKEAKMKSLSGSSHNWNILFLGMNSVADIIAEKYNVEKSELLSGESKKESVATRLAIAETQVVLETRKFLIENGVQLDAFSQPAAKRSKTVIIVKHLPAKTSSEELNELFSQHGTIHRILLPPSGMVALIEFQDPTEAKNAFKKLAYRRFHHLPLYLEWAPVDGLKEPLPKTEENESTAKDENSEEVNESQVDEVPLPGTTLFVKNLNFNTKEEDFRKHFAKCGPLHSASISTKKDIKTGKLLAMGYGFVQYKTKESAVRALSELQQSKLDGHSLEIKFATRASTTSSKVTTIRKKYEVKKQLSSKILVRNIPFQASEKEIRELFSQFGMLKYVRLPKKMGIKDEHRGFGFVDYMTESDAKNAFEALCHSTHLYGRRLVLEWANPESEDVAEIRKKTARDFAGSSGPPTKLRKTKLKEDIALASSGSLPTDESKCE